MSAIQRELREKQAIYLPHSLRRRLRVWSAILDRQISDLIAGDLVKHPTQRVALAVSRRTHLA